jgi:glucose-1-phosphate cytidylyltransferase
MFNSDFTIELGKKTITSYNSHEEANWKVTLVNTGLTSLKGARLKKIEKYIDDSDTFMATYGDGVADININNLLTFHRSHGKIATLTGVNTPSRFGTIKTNGDAIKEFIEKPKLNSYISGGFFVFNKKIFDYLTTEDSCDLENIPLSSLAKEGELMMYKHDGSWYCLDTIRDMDYLNELWNTGKAFWKV